VTGSMRTVYRHVSVLIALLTVAAMGGNARAEVKIVQPACGMPPAFFEDLATSIEAIVAGSPEGGTPPAIAVECADVDDGLRIAISLTSADGKIARAQREVSRASALAQMRAMVRALIAAETPKSAEGPPAHPARELEEVPTTPREVRLRKIQTIEGPEFSQEKYDTYRHRKAGGVVLVVSFPTLLVTSLVFAVAQEPGTICFACDDASDDRQRSEKEERYRIAAWVTLGSAALSAAIGIPLLISGKRGVRRQLYLRDNAQSTAIAFGGVGVRGFGFTF
jgi:hypothetical protein